MPLRPPARKRRHGRGQRFGFGGSAAAKPPPSLARGLAADRPAAAVPDHTRLSAEEYEFAEWRFARVSTDYHAEFRSFFYSVPHALIRQQVDIRATARMIEIFHRGKRVAVHQRRYGGPRYGTDPAHMPSSHRRYAEWTPERFRRWGASIGPQTEGLIVAILASRPHPEQGFRTCLGILRLYRDLAASAPRSFRHGPSRSAA